MVKYQNSICMTAGWAPKNVDAFGALALRPLEDPSATPLDSSPLVKDNFVVVEDNFDLVVYNFVVVVDHAELDLVPKVGTYQVPKGAYEHSHRSS